MSHPAGRLEGKRALVTGGASGIGEAIVRSFLHEGAQVVVADRTESGRGHVESLGAVYEVCDVADPDQLEHVAARARQELGGVDVAVANAGYELLGDALELGLDEWDRHQAVMLRGVLVTFRSVLPLMIERGSGSLVAVASQLSFVGLPRFVSYLTAKAGLLGLVRGLAIDFARHGIRANALCPGPTMTPLIQRQLVGVPDAEAEIARMAADTVMNRLGRPEEIAAGALFLASDESSFMTGATLVLDGGYTAR